MTNQEIREYHQLQKRWTETELGSLFERFVCLHARAWQLDGEPYREKAAERAYAQLEPVEKELREKLMEITGITAKEKR